METNANKPTEARRNRRMIFGVAVILIGVILLGANTGFVSEHWKHIFISWQMLLIVIGIANLLNRDNWVPGVILITVGGFFLLPKLFFLPVNFSHLFWPVILIAIGLFVLFKRMPAHRMSHLREGDSRLDEGYIREDNIFGGSKRRIVNQDFKGGEINCIFGGAEVDLTQARLAPGTNTLEANCIFGGVTIIVPCEWKVELKMTSVLGGFSDKRTCIKENPDPTSVLIIKGSAVFGGGEIKSY